MNRNPKHPTVDYFIRTKVLDKIAADDYHFVLPKLSEAAWETVCASIDECERLEFLGDSLIGTVVAEELYLNHTSGNPGMYSAVKSVLVSNLIFYRLLRKGKPFETITSAKAGGDCFETIIAAFMRESGYAALQLWGKEIYSPLISVAVGAYHGYWHSRKQKLQAYLDYNPSDMQARDQLRSLNKVPRDGRNHSLQEIRKRAQIFLSPRGKFIFSPRLKVNSTISPSPKRKSPFVICNKKVFSPSPLKRHRPSPLRLMFPDRETVANRPIKPLPTLFRLGAATPSKSRFPLAPMQTPNTPTISKTSQFTFNMSKYLQNGESQNQLQLRAMPLHLKYACAVESPLRLASKNSSKPLLTPNVASGTNDYDEFGEESMDTGSDDDAPALKGKGTAEDPFDLCCSPLVRT